MTRAHGMRAHITRRGVLLAGGGIGLAAAGLGGAGVAMAGTATPAALPQTQRFDMTKPSYDLFRGRKLAGGTVMQGFAFDNTNKRLFIVQAKDGSSHTSGDLCITKLVPQVQSGTTHWVVEGDPMYLLGYGHGVSLAAEPASDGGTWLWTEAAAGDGGYGTKLARFTFVAGRTLQRDDSRATVYAPVAGASEYTCGIDPVYDRLIVRYEEGGKRIAAYDLAAASGGDFAKRLVDFAQPEISDTGDNLFQGYAAMGSYLYCLTGHSDMDNAKLWTIDMNTHAVVGEAFHTTAGSTLSFREPEGMAVYRTDSGEPRLFFGFASGETPGQRTANIFYKNVLRS